MRQKINRVEGANRIAQQLRSGGYQCSVITEAGRVAINVGKSEGNPGRPAAPLGTILVDAAGQTHTSINEGVFNDVNRLMTVALEVIDIRPDGEC